MAAITTEMPCSTQELSPVLSVLRSHQHRRRNTMFYVASEPGDPMIRSLIAAETSLQILLDYVLPPLDIVPSSGALNDHLATMIDTLSFFTGSTTPFGHVEPIIELRAHGRPVHYLTPAVSASLLQAVMVLSLGAVANGATLIFVSLRSDAGISIHVEMDIKPLGSTDYAIVNSLVGRHDGTLSWVDHTPTVQNIEQQVEACHWEAILRLPL